MTIWERGLYTIKKIIITLIILISVLECVIYIKEKNIKKQQLLDMTLTDINKKEEEIKTYKDQLEEYKEIKQQSEAQAVKIEEQEITLEELKKELENKKVQLDNIENQIKNHK